MAEKRLDARKQGILALRCVSGPLQPVKYSCAFPTTRLPVAIWGSRAMLCTDKNYCFVNCNTRQNLTLGIAVPLHSDTGDNPKDANPEEEDKIIVNCDSIRKDLPQFDGLLLQAPVSKITPVVRTIVTGDAHGRSSPATQRNSWLAFFRRPFFTRLYKSPLKSVFAGLGALGSLYLLHRACTYFVKK